MIDKSNFNLQVFSKRVILKVINLLIIPLNKLDRIFEVIKRKKTTYPDELILQDIFSEFQGISNSKSLDLGSGPFPKNPFDAKQAYGVDLRNTTNLNVIVCDLSVDKLPFEDNSIDYISAYDVLEHIPRVTIENNKTIYPFINLMNEIYRVLKDDGVFFNTQPCYPSSSAFQDPTHINIMSEDTIELYFCKKNWAHIYGFNGSFEMLRDGWIGSSYFSLIKKVALINNFDNDYFQR